MLSIIVPTYQEQRTIKGFLSDLNEAMKGFNNYHVFVIDSGNDQTADRVREFTTENSLQNVVVYSADKGRALQMNRGAELACNHAAGKGQHYLLFLHCDTRLPANMLSWYDSITAKGVEWGFFRVKLSGSAKLFRALERSINLRSRLTSIGTGDQCLFVSESLWRKVGGFASIAIMEDVELCKRLRTLNSPYIHSEHVITSSRRWEENGIFRTVTLMWLLRLGYFLGVRPERLSHWYRS